MNGSGKKENWFIPQKVSAGSVERNCDGVSVLSYRDKFGVWRFLSRFKALTGYSPGGQKDAAKFFRKQVLNAVVEVDNVPTGGFRFAGYKKDGWHSSPPGKQAHDVLVEDPRGFKFAMPHSKFFDLLGQAGATMSEGVLDGKYVYANDGFNEATLVRAEGEFYDGLASSSAEYYGAWKDKGVTAKDLTPGLVCVATRGLPKGPYMYAGKFRTFSPKYQEEAISKGTYDFQWSKDDDYGYWYDHVDTADDMMVFCPLFKSEYPADPLYYIRKTAHKMFEHAAEGLRDKLTTRLGAPATLENVLAGISESIVFNRFSEESLAARKMVVATPDEIRRAFDPDGNVWPFSQYFSTTALTCDDGDICLPFTTYRGIGQRPAVYVKTAVRGGRAVNSDMQRGEELEQFLSSKTVLRPYLEFENGKPAPGQEIIRIYGKTIYGAIKR